MSFEAAAKAMKWKPRTSSQKLILILLADCHNAETGLCNPSLRYLTEQAMVSKSTITSSLKDLESQGYFKRISGGQSSEGQNFSTRYILNLEGVVQLSDNPSDFENECSEGHESKGLGSAEFDSEGGSAMIGLPSPTTGLRGSDDCTRVGRSLDGGSPTAGHKPVTNQEVTKNSNTSNASLDDYTVVKLSKDWLPEFRLKPLDFPKEIPDHFMIDQVSSWLVWWLTNKPNNQNNAKIWHSKFFVHVLHRWKTAKLKGKANPVPEYRQRNYKSPTDMIAATEQAHNQRMVDSLVKGCLPVPDQLMHLAPENYHPSSAKEASA